MKLTIVAFAMSFVLSSTGAFASVVVHEKNKPSDHQEQMGVVVHENNANSGQLPAIQNQGTATQNGASINFTRTIRQ